MSNNYKSTLQSNNTELSSNNLDLQNLIDQANSLPEAGGSNPVLQDKTVTPTTSTQTVKADSGYDGLDTVTVNAMPTATQATPSITVNSSTGLITATATQTAGYISSGTKSATKQLAFQAAKTITPGTTNQTAVAANTYVGGAITVTGDSNLIAGNIKKGTSIFGVAGDYEGSGSSGGDTSMEDVLITGDFTTYTNNRVTSIRKNAFVRCSSLTSVSFPVCTYIGSGAFDGCFKLISVSFPVCTYIGSSAFSYCSGLTSVNFPVCSYIGESAFDCCSGLTSVNFPVCTYIGPRAFGNCSRLTSVNFPNCSDIGGYAFVGCSKLISVSFPVCSVIGKDAFNRCSSLISVSFPNCSGIGANAFSSCSSLTLADFGNSTSKSCTIYSSAFLKCSKLTTLILRYGSVITLSNVNAFTSTPMSVSTLIGAFGSIYVPASLVAAYKSATNWATYADRITAIVE